jgi:hypothetical protein
VRSFGALCSVVAPLSTAVVLFDLFSVHRALDRALDPSLRHFHSLAPAQKITQFCSGCSGCRSESAALRPSAGSESNSGTTPHRGTD